MTVKIAESPRTSEIIPGKRSKGEAEIKTALSQNAARQKRRPSIPATRAIVPASAVSTARIVTDKAASLSAPIKSTELSRKKKGIINPVSPRRTDWRAVFICPDPAIPDAT